MLHSMMSHSACSIGSVDSEDSTGASILVLQRQVRASHAKPSPEDSWRPRQLSIASCAAHLVPLALLA
jgi:hypothetical protein